jgi:hypothetical protein
MIKPITCHHELIVQRTRRDVQVTALTLAAATWSVRGRSIAMSIINVTFNLGAILLPLPALRSAPLRQLLLPPAPQVSLSS